MDWMIERVCMGGVKVDKAHRWTSRVVGRVTLTTEPDELRNRLTLVAKVIPTGIPHVTIAPPLYDAKLLESDGRTFTLTGYEYHSGGTPPRIQIVGQTWVMTPRFEGNAEAAVLATLKAMQPAG